MRINAKLKLYLRVKYKNKIYQTLKVSEVTSNLYTIMRLFGKFYYGIPNLEAFCQILRNYAYLNIRMINVKFNLISCKTNCNAASLYRIFKNLTLYNLFLFSSAVILYFKTKNNDKSIFFCRYY